MSKDSMFEPKYCRVLGNQLKLMYSIKAPIRSLMKTYRMLNEALNDDAQPTSEPATAVRILKRPQHLARGQIVGRIYTQPLKGLEQRRREYEQARLRILGEARNPEDDDEM
ncbi:hypothetical protein RR48_08964 [Papilio machaon]|uniref:SUZ domain-containing protein n=1 Tax=Papilio machaon TaxID=76193 RepID=A0A194QYC7_PAPMA|nr:hypothetical protein RR48_08964 [Papilio machaon]